jgi:hypothetical protein
LWLYLGKENSDFTQKIVFFLYSSKSNVFSPKFGTSVFVFRFFELTEICFSKFSKKGAPVLLGFSAICLVLYHQYGIIVYHTDLQETVGSNVLIYVQLSKMRTACLLQVTTSTNAAN